MARDREQEPNLEQTLETLRRTLDPKAYRIAKAALERELQERRESAELAVDHELTVQLVEGYDYAMERSQAGYAHVDGQLIGSSHAYLKRKAGVPIGSQLDRKVRLYSGYVVAYDPESVDDPRGTVQAIRAAQINPSEVFRLIRQYWKENRIVHGDNWPVPRGLEDVIDNEMLDGDLTWEYFPSPGLAQQIKQELIKSGIIKK